MSSVMAQLDHRVLNHAVALSIKIALGPCPAHQAPYPNTERPMSDQREPLAVELPSQRVNVVEAMHPDGPTHSFLIADREQPSVVL
jgi:hypothetical protein